MKAIQAWTLLGLLATAVDAGAQPAVFARRQPAPNDEGWINTRVRIDYVCARAVSCPGPQVIRTEGAGQQIEATARDAAGAEDTLVSELHIDFTAPEVTIAVPGPGHETTNPLATVTAQAFDALSGLASATCNGMPAALSSSGSIQCVVVLAPGLNDLVVEASDRAGNSGSAGVRVLLHGPPTQLHVVPEVAGVLTGTSRTFQVLDEFGLDVPDVLWQVDNPALAEMSGDGRHVLTALAPGPVVVTASYGGVTAASLVTVYTGDRLPPGAVRWKVGGLSVVQMPDTRPLSFPGTRLVATHQKPGGIAIVESINQTTGRLDWRMRPGTNVGERMAVVREVPIGGAVMVVHAPSPGGSAIVRSGEFTRGAPWRYRSAGTIGEHLVLHGDGGVSFIETLPDGFSQLVGISGDYGMVVNRMPLPSGVHLALNVGCVAGANAAREVAAQVGPVGSAPEGPIAVPLVVSNDREDFARCGSVSGRLRRTLYLATFGSEVSNVDALRTYEVPAGSVPPSLALFPVSSDGRGGLLVPWTAVYTDTGVRESKVVRVSEWGQQEFTLPTAGKIWLVGRQDIAVLTDGTLLVAFNVLTGTVRWTRSHPTGVRIIGVRDGQVITHVNDKEGAFDMDGRPIPKRP